jgi:prephenate dehydrogenase
MNKKSDLVSCIVVIYGLGLMGGSLALALRNKCAQLIGIDIDTDAVSFAQQKKVVDIASSETGSFVSNADLIILATPVRTIISLLTGLPGFHHGNPIVLDLGSTKVEVVKAMESLPKNFDPIGGHPMCGKEKSSIRYADPKLFQDAPFVLTPLTRTSQKARILSEQLIDAVGANLLWLDAPTHDRWTAATSHLPYLIANSLASVSPEEVKSLIGSGFRSTTRLAESSEDMMLDILITNRRNILDSMKTYQAHFLELVNSLESENYEAIIDLLSQGKERYRRVVM